MNKYTFPFNSCEMPSKNIISQPYSAFINIVLCFIVLYYLLKSDTPYSRLFLFSVFLFNAFHTFSHLTHIKSEWNIQFLLTHFSAIFASVCLFLLFQKITKRNLDPMYLYLLGFLYIMDVVLIMYDVSHIYNIITFIVILSLAMILYYPYTSSKIQTNIKYIIGLSFVTLFLQIIELKYCKKMLEFIPGFPVHSIVELSSFVPIILLCRTFYKL